VSIDVGPDCGAGDPLFDLAQQHALPVTWGVRDPIGSPLAERILLATAPHELAIAGDRQWMAPSVSRRQFSLQLAQRLELARSRGIRIRTLLAYRNLTDRRQAVLPRAGIHALVEPGRFLRPAQLKTLRLGLWTLPVTRTLPSPRWRSWKAWRGRAKLNQAAQLARAVHWRIDAERIGGDRAAWREVTKLFAHAGELQTRGMLSVMPIGSLIEETYGAFDRPARNAA